MMVSVYITSYNQKKYLAEAIESVLQQTLKPKQIIIVDDASQDGSQELVSGYVSRYPETITPIFHQINMGVAQTRNDALQAVTGEYVTYLDGDDRFLPKKLETEIKLLKENPPAKIAFSNYAIIDGSGERIDIWASKYLPHGNIFPETFGRDFPKKRLFRDEMVHYESWKRVGFYDPSLPVYEDYDMRIRLTRRLETIYSGQILTEHRRLEKGLSKLESTLYLDAFEYICKKNSPLTTDLPSTTEDYILKKLDEWRAALIRRMGREALRHDNRDHPSRRKALHHYLHSLRHHLYFDTNFWLEWLLTYEKYQRAKSILYQIRGSNIKNG